MPHVLIVGDTNSAIAPPNQQPDNNNSSAAHNSNSSRLQCLDKGEAWREGGISRSCKEEELDETTAPRLLLPLPLEVMSQVLIYADGATLTEAFSVSKVNLAACALGCLLY